MKAGRFVRLTVLTALLACPGSILADGPLPKFTYQGVALQPSKLKFAPTGELERSSIIKMEGRVKTPLGKYYLYFSPHKHVGIGLAYSDSIEGPWTEYQGNPLIEKTAIPDIRWIEATGKFHIWGHQKNKQSEMWTSEDGIHFEYHSVSISANNIGTRNATYTRAYEYPLERYGSRYIMLYSGFIVDQGIRCVWLAHSKDGLSWIQEKTPLVEPIEGEGNDLYGPSLIQWQGRNFVVYQDHTANRGGNVKYVELDKQLNPVGNKGERHLLIDPVADSPIGNRYRGCEFYREGDTLYMYASGGDNPRIIVYATAKVDSDSPTDTKTNDARPPKADATPKDEVEPKQKKGKPNKKVTVSDNDQPQPASSMSLDEILKDVKLETVYETTFDQPIRMIREEELLEDGKIANPLAKDVDWVLEGKAEVSVKEGRLHLKNDADHCVLWNTREFPESFIAEWDFQHHAPQGTAIIFFAAQANNGGSIFKAGLSKRGGRFGNYTRGEINCYHTSYTATDEQGVPRGATHLKKDGKDVEKSKLANGFAPIDGETDKSFQIRLAKLKNRIILEIDGKISFDITDDGEHEGSQYTSGQIGCRQMRHTEEASYGGLKVQSVKFPSP